MDVTAYAHQDGVRTLYKYMGFTSTSAEHERRAVALLAWGELYFPIASQLNDPFDSTPHFKFRGESPEQTLKMLLEDVDRYGKANGWSPGKIVGTKAELTEEAARGTLGARMASLNEKRRRWLRSYYPMCCLSATRESTLMWAYYSGGHTGICVHFDATEVPFATAQRVLYRDEYPHIQLPLEAGTAPTQMITLALLTKSRVWEHEREYRIVNLPMTGDETLSSPRMLDPVLKWLKPQLALIPGRMIRGVTIGASMPDSHVETVLRAAHDAKPRIPVDRAVSREDRYELEFRPING